MKFSTAFVILIIVLIVESSNNLTIYPCISKYISQLIIRIGYDLLIDETNTDFSNNKIKGLIATEIAKEGHDLTSLNACLNKILAASTTLYSNVKTSLPEGSMDASKLKTLLADGLGKATMH